MVSIDNDSLYSHDAHNGFSPRRVAWTKGAAHSEVAEILGNEPIRVTGDLDTSCVTNRVHLLVTKRFPRFLLVPTIVPVGFDLNSVHEVTVAVGDGPHTPRAVRTAAQIARSLGIPGTLLTAYTSEYKANAANERLSRYASETPDFDTIAIETSDPRSITDHLSRDTLLVHGAGGGSFLDRHFTGTGSRLTSRARGCVLVVKDAPERCFQVMLDPTEFAISPDLFVADALQLIALPFAPVVTAHQLVGIVRVRDLMDVSPGHTIGDVISQSPALNECDPTETIVSIREEVGPGPIPVANADGDLVGVIT
ncbi:MAG: CBS domain-containing protein [Acidimicrobiia bacterium]